MGWEGSIDASPFLLRWHYLTLCKMYRLLCADTVQVLAVALQGLRSIFYISAFLQLPKSQFNQPLDPNRGVSCGAWMGKASGAPPHPYPCVPEEEDDCKSFGTQTGVWPGPKTTLFLCALGIAITPRATARALGSNQHHGGGVGERHPLKQRAAHFFKQGEKRAGRKARAKTTGVAGSADGVRRRQCGGVKTTFPGT